MDGERYSIKDLKYQYINGLITKEYLNSLNNYDVFVMLIQINQYEPNYTEEQFKEEYVKHFYCRNPHSFFVLLKQYQQLTQWMKEIDNEVDPKFDFNIDYQDINAVLNILRQYELHNYSSGYQKRHSDKDWIELLTTIFNTSPLTVVLHPKVIKYIEYIDDNGEPLVSEFHREDQFLQAMIDDKFDILKLNIRYNQTHIALGWPYLIIKLIEAGVDQQYILNSDDFWDFHNKVSYETMLAIELYVKQPYTEWINHSHLLQQDRQNLNLDNYYDKIQRELKYRGDIRNPVYIKYFTIFASDEEFKTVKVAASMYSYRKRQTITLDYPSDSQFNSELEYIFNDINLENELKQYYQRPIDIHFTKESAYVDSGCLEIVEADYHVLDGIYFIESKIWLNIWRVIYVSNGKWYNIEGKILRDFYGSRPVPYQLKLYHQHIFKDFVKKYLTVETHKVQYLPRPGRV